MSSLIAQNSGRDRTTQPSGLDSRDVKPVLQCKEQSIGLDTFEFGSSFEKPSILILKAQDKLLSRNPNLRGIDIETDIQHQANTPFPIMNATLWLNEYRKDTRVGTRNEAAKTEFMVANDLLSAWFTITDPTLRGAGLSAVFFEKYLN